MTIALFARLTYTIRSCSSIFASGLLKTLEEDRFSFNGDTPPEREIGLPHIKTFGLSIKYDNLASRLANHVSLQCVLPAVSSAPKDIYPPSYPLSTTIHQYTRAINEVLLGFATETSDSPVRSRSNHLKGPPLNYATPTSQSKSGTVQAQLSV